jgi:hypothetical protein
LNLVALAIFMRLAVVKAGHVPGLRRETWATRLIIQSWGMLSARDLLAGDFYWSRRLALSRPFQPGRDLDSATLKLLKSILASLRCRKI